MTEHYGTRMTSKGQITVPAKFREELGLEPGDRLEVSLEEGVLYVRRAESHALKSFQSIGDRPLPDDMEEIEGLIERSIAEDALREELDES